MMRSLYSGVSGLKNHEIRMDVIGNNVANINSYGFKKGRVSFQDLISQRLRGAQNPRDEVGGVNPKEIGLGVTSASIDQIFHQGSLKTTGVKTDVAVLGDGFFTLRKGEELLYTRDGNFSLDRDGFLVVPGTGQHVQGWVTRLDENGLPFLNLQGEIEDVRVPIYRKDPAFATTDVRVKSNLDLETPIIPANATRTEIEKGTRQTSIDVYDSSGERHKVELIFTRVPGTRDRWTMRALVEGIDGEALLDVAGTQASTANEILVDFSSKGLLQSIRDSGAGADIASEGELRTALSFTLPNGTRQTVNILLGTAGSAEDSVTQFAAQSSTKAYFQDGYTLGYLKDYRIGIDGVITGSFSNGQERSIGAIALATFTNPAGLEKMGSNTFKESINSDFADIGPAGTVGRGEILSGTLELSNVNLAEEFTDMIVTQRGFQANSRSITTSDQMLQELLSLKR